MHIHVHVHAYTVAVMKGEIDTCIGYVHITNVCIHIKLMLNGRSNTIPVCLSIKKFIFKQQISTFPC